MIVLARLIAHRAVARAGEPKLQFGLVVARLGWRCTGPVWSCSFVPCRPQGCCQGRQGKDPSGGGRLQTDRLGWH
eukprot:7715529-Alexandrium_andersonii.AAC.1